MCSLVFCILLWFMLMCENSHCFALNSLSNNPIGDAGVTALVQCMQLVFGFGEYNLSIQRL